MPPSWPPKEVVKEIISEMSLNERVTLANLTEDSIDVLQGIFDWYIGVQTGLAPGDDDYSNIMKELWKHLKQTHRLKAIK